MVERCWPTPVVTIYTDRFSKILGRRVTVDELSQYIPWLGMDIEDIGYDYIKVEYNPNRPDFGTPVGIARSYQGIMGERRGIIKYNIRDSGLQIKMDQSVKRVRPYILGCIIKNIELDDDTLNEIIEFQEDLHMGIGRGRKKMAIGLHNLNAIKFPVRYTVVNGDFRFIPLGFEEEAAIKDILKQHPKGREYGYILSGFKEYPIILDDENKVLSFPPIINGVYTELKPGDRNIFIDVTGTDLETISNTLVLLATTFSDYGGEVYKVKVIDGENVIESPTLEYREVPIEFDEINKLLGLKLTLRDAVEALKSSRFDALYDGGGVIRGVIPPYRIDILHPVDLVEEVALGYGFWRIEPESPKLYTIGKLREEGKIEDNVIDIMVGFGFQEVINSILTNPEEQYDKMMVNRPEFIEVKLSKSKLYRSIRTWLIPILLKNLYRSKSAEYPQKIFELGPVAYIENNKVIETTDLAAAIISSDTGYFEIKSLFDSLMKILELDNYILREGLHKSFIPGRVGEIFLNNILLGIIGEIHPQVLDNYQLTYPTVAFEINLEKIYKLKIGEVSR